MASLCGSPSKVDSDGNYSVALVARPRHFWPEIVLKMSYDLSRAA